MCVKDRACLRTAVPAYCFNIFGSTFGVLFCLLIKKLILESETIWQSIKMFPCAVWSVRAFLHMDKEEMIFSWKLHIGMVWIVLDNYLFIRPENSKASLKFSHKLFLKKRYELLLCPNDIHTVWLLITLCNMRKGLVT